MPVRFCNSCMNMLYPKENAAKRRANEGRELVYACRNCDHKESVEVSREPVYRHILVHDATEKLAVSHDIVNDPTLPRTYNYTCPECGTQEAVYYQSPVGKNDDSLVLVFMCANQGCQHTWLSCDEN